MRLSKKRQPGSEKASRCDQAERCSRRKGEEQADNAERTEAGPYEVECVNTANLIRVSRESEPDSRGAEEEWQDKEEIG